MIVTVTPNPALDITGRVPQVVPGESHRLTQVVTRAGGKGVNVAAVAAAMGHPALAVLPVGPESLAVFSGDLAARGVPCHLVESATPTRRSVAVVDDEGEATVLNEEGLPQPASVWAALTAAVDDALAAGGVLVVSGSLAPGTPADLVAGLGQEGTPTVLDVRGEPLAEALRVARANARALVVKPNLSEARETLGDPTADAAACARALRDRGATVALVSDGAKGVSAAVGDEVLTAALPEPVAGNPTGAGDAMTAALAAHLDGLSETDLTEPSRWAEILREGVAWSAAAVLRPLAGEVDPADVARLRPQVRLGRG